jgi:hypothetical protein
MNEAYNIQGVMDVNKDEKKVRNLNLVSSGNHHRPFINVGDDQFPVSKSQQPDQAHAYGYEFASCCPCTSGF